MRSFTIPILLVLIFSMNIKAETIYDFRSSKNLRDWQVVDDGVMGGRSRGFLKKNEDGHGQFSGFISLENYLRYIQLFNKLVGQSPILYCTVLQTGLPTYALPL